MIRAPFTASARARATADTQAGATLVVTLIFLLVMSLLAMSVFLMATTQLRIVGHQQSRQEALAAAQLALEQVLSAPGFASQPARAVSSPVLVDLAGTAYRVDLTPAPTCLRVRTVKNSELDPTLPQDRACIRTGSLDMPGLVLASDLATGQMADPSLCAQTDWHLRAQVADPRTGTTIAVHQGIALRVLESEASLLCP